MKQLVITTKSWQSLIDSLKCNSKHGYNSLESLKHDGVYYTAVLCQGFDEKYVERLKIVTGEEDETGTLLYFLSLQPQPIALQLTPEENEVDKQFVEQKEVVETKIKRAPRGSKK